jgi:hypothetical protein
MVSLARTHGTPWHPGGIGTLTVGVKNIGPVPCTMWHTSDVNAPAAIKGANVDLISQNPTFCFTDVSGWLNAGRLLWSETVTAWSLVLISR